MTTTNTRISTRTKTRFTRKTKKALPKTFKVIFADRELNFIGDEIFEASDNSTAWDLAQQISDKRFGNLLELYSLTRNAEAHFSYSG